MVAVHQTSIEFDHSSLNCKILFSHFIEFRIQYGRRNSSRSTGSMNINVHMCLYSRTYRNDVEWTRIYALIDHSNISPIFNIYLMYPMSPYLKSSEHTT
jgi:hypothetical protein